MNHNCDCDNRSPYRRSTISIALLAISVLGAERSSAQGLPAPQASGIEHVIVVTMENRSFDHFLGWLPHADGVQEDVTFVDSSGTPYETFRLAPDYQGCSYSDPDH